jgi:transposase InsO family protein
MTRETIAGDASVLLLCATFDLSRAAYYAEARRQRCEAAPDDDGKIIALPRRPRHTSAEVVLLRIREVLARETSTAWGVRKVWATLRREGLKVSRRRVHALMRAEGLVLVRDSEPNEPARGHVAVPEPDRRIATDLTTVWTKRDGVVALVPTIDCGDRTAIIEVTKDQHGPAVLASVETKLIAAFGSPANVPDGVELRTDHGPQYTGADCAALCERVSVRWAAPGSPS